MSFLFQSLKKLRLGYKDIKNGVLSRDQDGSIDFSELLRVYGEPFSGKHSKHTDTSPTQTINTPEYTDNTVIELKNQIDFLKKQLEKAEDREAKANSRIDTLLTLIEMKPTQLHPTPTSDQSSVQSSPSQVEPIVKLLYYSYKIRKKLEITHRLSRSTILYAYV